MVERRRTPIDSFFIPHFASSAAVVLPFWKDYRKSICLNFFLCSFPLFRQITKIGIDVEETMKQNGGGWWRRSFPDSSTFVWVIRRMTETWKFCSHEHTRRGEAKADKRNFSSSVLHTYSHPLRRSPAKCFLVCKELVLIQFLTLLLPLNYYEVRAKKSDEIIQNTFRFDAKKALVHTLLNATENGEWLWASGKASFRVLWAQTEMCSVTFLRLASAVVVVVMIVKLSARRSNFSLCLSRFSTQYFVEMMICWECFWHGFLIRLCPEAALDAKRCANGKTITGFCF